MNKARCHLAVLLLTLCALCALTASAQQRRMRLMQWNVENLFDTIANGPTHYADFTPQGDYAWNTLRYRAKLSRLARTIACCGEASPPALVALCEVENDSVLTDLTRRSLLARLGYDYVITHSLDERGINVALLYQPELFRPLTVGCHRVPPPGRHVSPSRDLLHVAGLIPTGDTLDVVVCHLPSQLGGRAAQRYRQAVARRLRLLADSVMQRRRAPHLVITGDFNTAWPDRLFSRHLGCAPLPADTLPLPPARSLLLLTHGLRGRADVAGSYKFQGEWSQLDHFIVSAHMLTAAASLRVQRTACLLADFPHLLETDRGRTTLHPRRTYLGTYYHGGLSDHLPVLLDLWW